MTTVPDPKLVPGANTAPMTEKQRQIVRGALSAFLQYGYSGASMDKVASEAGVSKQTVYSYYKDKDSLFIAIVEDLMGRFAAKIGNPGMLALEPPAFLTTFATQFLSRADDWEFVAFLRLLIGEAGRFPQLAEMFIRKQVEPGNKLFTMYVASTLNWPDPEAVTSVWFCSLVHFIINQELMQGKHLMPMPRERFIKGLVDMMLAPGLKPRPSRPVTPDAGPRPDNQ